MAEKKVLIHIPGCRMDGVVNTFRNLMRYKDDRLDVELLVEKELSDTTELEELFPDLVIHRIPYLRPQTLFGHIRGIFKVLKNSSPDIIVAHSADRIPILFFVACFAGVKRRVYHCRASNFPTKKWWRSMVYRISVALSIPLATDLWACSEKAGNFYFGSRPFRLIKNGVDVEKFRPNPSIRNQIRNSLNITNNYVIGHVGRFCFEKNHEFIIDEFSYVLNIIPNAKLLLVGDGPLFNTIKNKVTMHNLQDQVIFTGNVSDTSIYYRAMDVFFFPSIYEGLPNVVIEAQAAGLKVCLSDTLTKEVAITDNIIYLPLIGHKRRWAEELAASVEPVDRIESFIESGFEVKVNVATIESQYLSM